MMGVAAGAASATPSRCVDTTAAGASAGCEPAAAVCHPAPPPPAPPPPPRPPQLLAEVAPSCLATATDTDAGKTATLGAKPTGAAPVARTLPRWPPTVWPLPAATAGGLSAVQKGVVGVGGGTSPGTPGGADSAPRTAATSAAVGWRRSGEGGAASAGTSARPAPSPLLASSLAPEETGRRRRAGRRPLPGPLATDAAAVTSDAPALERTPSPARPPALPMRPDARLGPPDAAAADGEAARNWPRPLPFVAAAAVVAAGNAALSPPSAAVAATAATVALPPPAAALTALPPGRCAWAAWKDADDFHLNARPQPSTAHTYGRSPVCNRWCTRRLVRLVNRRPQVAHGKAPAPSGVGGGGVVGEDAEAGETARSEVRGG